MMLQDKNNLIYISSDQIKTDQNKPFSTRLEGIHWVIMCAVAITAIFAIAAITFHLSLATDDSLILPDANRNSIDSMGAHEFIYRSKWGGKPSLSEKKLHHPVDFVILAHTATSFCSTFAECSKFVRSAQNYHFQSGLEDIAYNFLIGGDGNIYVGRGWDSVNYQRNQSISVSFIGNYLYDYLSEDMIDALQELLTEGVDLGKLKQDYKIVCHNQTTATLSPGVNVYKVVKTWAHFQAGRLKK